MKAIPLHATTAALLLGLSACSGDGDDSTGPDGNGPSGQSQVDTVRLVGVTFQPSSLTIRPGGTVVWVNTQSIGHTVTPDGHSQWQSVFTNSPGEVLRVRFDNVGTFNYFCTPHLAQGMTGSISVQRP